MNKIKPLVSVIVPIYNVEKYLSESLDSLIAQSYTNLEIILVDDGSPDNCGKICDEYSISDSRIKVIHKKNGGVSSARNAGIEVSTGEWIYFMDSDDVIDKELINEALNTALKDGTDMCFFDYNSGLGKISVKQRAIESEENIFKNVESIETLSLYFSKMGNIWDFITKAELIRNKIKFDETISLFEDDLFKFQIYGQIKSYSYLHKELYHYRIRSSSAGKNFEAQRNYIDMMNSLHQKMKFVIQNGNYPDNAVIVVNTKYIGRLLIILRIAFNDKISFKCNYDLIKNFIESDEYQKARLNCNEKFLPNSVKLYIRLKEPNRLITTLIYFLAQAKAAIIG